MIRSVFFYFLATGILFSAYFVVTAHNLFRCAMGLIAALLGVAGLYLLMNAQFLSAVQVTVYVGGIVVLIVYVILLVADVTQKSFHAGARWRKGVAGVISATLFVLLARAILSHPYGEVQPELVRSATTVEIGRALLSPVGGFALAFEVMSVLLVAVLVGAVTIARAPISPAAAAASGRGESGGEGAGIEDADKPKGILPESRLDQGASPPLAPSTSATIMEKGTDHS
jgi:NADH-quinone oxidoreductase subunit J